MPSGWKAIVVFVGLALCAVPGIAVAQNANKPADAAPQDSAAVSLNEVVGAVVRIKTFINPDGRTRETLGKEREGSGVVIDSDGLVLTIGYLMVEAHAAEIVTLAGKTVPANIVGYDHETGFGLLKAITPLGIKPVALGRSADVKQNDPVLVAGFGGVPGTRAAVVMSKREFAGNWEYLLDDAIFTAPPHPAWSGAALIDFEGKLVGIGSLIVNDATGNGERVVGNMFVPIDKLPPILGDLLTDGYSNAPPAPWLGITTEDIRGTLTVSRVVPGSPAEKAGMKRGDVIVGVDGQAPRDLIDLYHKIRRLGAAGVDVPLDLQKGAERKRIDVKSMNRREHLKLNSTF